MICQEFIEVVLEQPPVSLLRPPVMQEVAALCDDIVIIANGRVAIDDSADGIRKRTGCEDLEDAFVRAIEMVEPT